MADRFNANHSPEPLPPISGREAELQALMQAQNESSAMQRNEMLMIKEQIQKQNERLSSHAEELREFVKSGETELTMPENLPDEKLMVPVNDIMAHVESCLVRE